MNAKERRNNSKLPHSELALYIKLYCDRKGSTKTKYQSNLIEATKSWLSLNESEKQKFHTKFKEYEEKYKKQFFLQIKNAKPYMKIKEVRNTDSTNNHSENKEPERNIPDNIPETEPAVSPPLEANSEHDYEKEETNYVPYTTPIGFEEQNQNRDEPGNSEEPPQPLLVEPIPPSIKTGHQLFYMLNSTPDESDKIAWKSLPQFEKNRYNRAVLLLKRDYISKYKEYLESLAPKDLFHYYYRTRF